MGRRAPTIKIREEDRATPERWSKSKTVSAYQHERAIMILESAAGVAVFDFEHLSGVARSSSRILMVGARLP
ncbi:MAG: hypothetical protein AAGI25_20880, partial [Bacteroidota bacterium]